MTNTAYTTDFSIYDIETPEENEAFAAISLNPTVTWAKFILTDDKPNLNKQRIPENEFENIIRTGIFMPIKMAYSRINDGHDESYPIGVISHLKKVNNQVHGLAALWERERPEDVGMIKERYQKKQPLQLSWEMFFTTSSISEDGVEDLEGVALRAVTLVGMPAYAGRTPVIAVASDTQQTPVEDKTLEELEQLQTEIAGLKEQLSTKDTELAAKDTLIAEKESLLAAKTEEITALQEELTQLRDYKAGIERAQEELDKLAAIKAKFIAAGVEKDEEYFAENKQTLLALTPEQLDFMLQETVSFASRKQNGEKRSSVEVPPLDANKRLTNNDLVAYLRNRATKK